MSLSRYHLPHGQAVEGTMDYPRQWYEVNEYLNGDTKDFNVLFLPEDYTQ